MRYLIPIGLLALLIVFLHRQFPYALSGEDAAMNLTYSVVVVLLIGSSILANRERLPEMLKYATVWIAIALLLVLGYSYRDVIMSSRLVAELMPSRPIVNAEGALVVRAGDNGHFFVDAEVNGAMVKFMIDTGASDIVLSPRDARRAGYALADLKYTRAYNTANGVVGGAPVMLDSLKVGPVEIRDIPASVNGAEMDGSLLGMTFLRQFREYRVEGNSLILQR